MPNAVRARALLAGVPLGVAAVLAMAVWNPVRHDARAPSAPVIDRAALTGPEAAGEVPTLPEPAADGSAVVVQGSGWGHSVGMSQYGAQAKAKAGRAHRDILGHYYPGTAVERHPAAERIVRVGLLRNRNVAEPDRLRLATEARGGEPPGRDVEVRLGDTVTALPRGEVWTLHVAGRDRLALRDADGRVRAEADAPAVVRFAFGDGEPTLLRLPQLARSGQPLSGTFRWGVLEVGAADGEVRPTLALPVERYLRGLAEMPSSWELEALKAQAVAGRTYAVRKVLDGLQADCACHLGATPHDQAFAGWEKEGGQGGRRWRTAVADTAGEVVTYAGELAWTFYSSSHGGRTEAAPDSWAYGEAQAQPYLVSVDDPWSLDPEVRNPRATWEVELPAAALARAVGLVELTAVEIVERTAGGSPAALRVEGVDLAGNAARYDFRGWRTGIAASDLKLTFRDELPSQQITAIELAP